MPETRKLVMKLNDDDASAIRAREEILGFNGRQLALLRTERRLFLKALLSRLGQDPNKQYYVDPDANLFEIIVDPDDEKKEGDDKN